MFKGNNNDTSGVVLVSLLLTLSREMSVRMPQTIEVFLHNIVKFLEDFNTTCWIVEYLLKTTLALSCDFDASRDGLFYQ